MARSRSCSFYCGAEDTPKNESHPRKEEIYNIARKKVRFGPVKPCVEQLNHWEISNCKQLFTDEEIWLAIQITEEIEDPANLLEAYACIRRMIRKRANRKGVYISYDKRLNQFIKTII